MSQSLARIYTVTTLHFSDQMYGRSPRTVAWYPSLETAQQSVVDNWGDIWETTYRYAVIEELEPGLYPRVVAEHWYEWIEDRYRPCAKPTQLEGVSHFSIG